MTGALVSSAGEWFVASGVRAHAAVLLFGLPYAGGGASAFREWRRALPVTIDLQAVQLPGRESRIAEPAAIDPARIAEALASRADRPYAIYGHSLGARMGFEVIRELRRRGARLPERFYVGGARPPDLQEPIARLGRRSDDGLVQGLEELGGTPAGVLDIPELRELLLPVLRADFGWLDSYRYQVEAPLPVPVVGFAGLADPVVPPPSMLGWARHTSGDFRLHTVPGDHFFLHTQAPRLLHLIAADLIGADRGPRDSGPAPRPGARSPVPTARRADLPREAARRAADPPAAVPLPEQDEVHIWLAPVDQLPGLWRATGELSARERSRASRFRSDTDRRRYVARCAVLRRLLQRYGVEVGTGELPTGPHGKPHVAHPSGIRFSLSHSAGQVLVAVATQEVGVDIECLRPLTDLEAFCEGALDDAERVEFAQVPADERLMAALRIWTAKEALLKATGDGLLIEPSRFSFAGQRPGDPWQPRVTPGLERLSPWRITHLPLDGAIGAVAVARQPWRLRFESVRFLDDGYGEDLPGFPGTGPEAVR